MAEPIDPGVDIGHVHLKVADVDRALGFYCDVLGFELMERYGDDAAFVSAGGYHHHIGLNSWESKGGSPPPPGTTGLYHVAIRYPSRRALADALRRLIDAGVPLQGASDHGVSEALYLADPDGNGIELYRDRPEQEWPPPRPGQKVEMYVRPLDLEDLLAEPGARLLRAEDRPDQVRLERLGAAHQLDTGEGRVGPHVGALARSPTPLVAGSGASCRVLRTPIAVPEALMKPLPESPGMPGVRVTTTWLQPPPSFWTTPPCFGLRFVTPPRSSELP